MLLLRGRATRSEAESPERKFLLVRRMVKIATGVAKATSRTDFGLTTPPAEIAAGCSENEFLQVP